MNTPEDKTVQLLQQAVNLLGILVTRGLPDDKISQKNRILLLDSAGMQPKAIADLVGTSSGTVSVRLSESKKKKTKKGSKE